MPPFRADHVGSLLRPQRLLDARAQHADGAIAADELTAIEDEAVRDVVRRQEQTGLRAVTDGEFRRGSWHMDFTYALGGVVPISTTDHMLWYGDEGVETWDRPGAAVADRITLERPIFAAAFSFLRDTASGAVAKITIPSLNVVAGILRGSIGDVYEDEELFWDDLIAAYAAQIAGIAELGCTYLQIDDTSFAHINDPHVQEQVTAAGGDPHHQHELYIARLNRALADRPAGMRITTHMCHGNLRGMWMSSGGYEMVAEALFNELDVDGFFLEFDDERSGSFAPLRFVPKGPRVVLGLVTTKRPELESQDELLRRIEEASQHVDIDQLCISPQCGFAATEEGNPLSEEDEFAKLRLVVETAQRVWGSTD